MILEIKNICKSFGDTEILHNISFTVESGKAFGLLGRNGAGKTTTIRTLMNVFPANSGEILLNGKKFDQNNYKIGYLPEERGLYPKKNVIDQLIYLAQLRGLKKAKAVENSIYWLEKLGVIEYKNRKLETLSKGNQQKIQLASTLVSDPDLIILDEPFSGLDPVNSQQLKDVVKELINSDKLVIFSSHQMSYVEEFCDDILIMNKGDIVLQGSLKEIKKEFGNNRILISSVNLDVMQLKQYIEVNFSTYVTVYNTCSQGVIVELLLGKTKKDLLKMVSDSDLDINTFQTYEPTLTDIFVDKAGDK